ncbi:MAG TPA: bifunctional diaminohydroxyphosphoribosylaminopyrimidine deaminase/5-amino-6-(5-phosphoribosylamino)uracil reductase RibD [Xanthomonadales bacterium]|nr:bifunctional diaminohydroxyphosphoribosylaminopyrimidine deaminase/5-amino-6-(5-phosphoribosylamino)uracil reductase RibD [Xanthomonadales bacterium]
MTTFTAFDHAMMARALRLAERGLYTTAPNPRVGCVIALDGHIVGEGFHARAGEPHAEVFALRDAGDKARGATAYVTLEPCSHHGRTPPCAEALVAAGIARVVAATTDPFPQVDGRGHAALEAAGIAVESGLMRDAARELNRGFFSRIERGRPWVRVKLATSLDGRVALADGESRWITDERARADVMRWRARSSAIMTGIGTVLADDPQLTVRLGDEDWFAAEMKGEAAFVPPLRVVLDSHLRIPAGRRVLDAAAPTLVCCEPEAVARNRHVPPAQVLSVPHHATGLGLAIVLAELAQRGVNELQVEAGPTLSGALLHLGLVDELLLYLDPGVIGDTGMPAFNLPPLASLDARVRFATTDHRMVGDTLRLALRPKAP